MQPQLSREAGVLPTELQGPGDAKCHSHSQGQGQWATEGYNRDPSSPCSPPPAEPVHLPNPRHCVCVWGGVSVLLHSLDPSYSFSHGPAGCFSPASSPLPGAGPAWQQKQQRGLSSWTHGEERRPGCCRPLPRLKSPNSHPPATSGIQTLGEAENGTGRRERGERGLLSGTRWGAAPNLERKAGLGEELETLREATPHPSGCRVARRQAFQKNP